MANKVKNPLRIIAEIELVSSHFGTVAFDEKNPSTVAIEKFDLPPGFNKKYSPLLLDLGINYPRFPVQDFYIDRGLRKRGRKVSGHYFENGFIGKKYCKLGLAWYSLHLKNWKPDPHSIFNGDNLLTAIDALYKALKTD